MWEAGEVPAWRLIQARNESIQKAGRKGGGGFKFGEGGASFKVLLR